MSDKKTKAFEKYLDEILSGKVHPDGKRLFLSIEEETLEGLRS